MAACPHHPQIEKKLDELDDLDKRVRQKGDRILVLEVEAKAMKEKFELIQTTQEKILEKVDALRSWQLYVFGAAAAVGFLYSLFSGPISNAIHRLVGI